jgi:hypothetical protein
MLLIRRAGFAKSGLARQVDMSAQSMRVLGQIVLDRKTVFTPTKKVL